MNLHVSRQFGTLGAGIITFITSVRLLPGVRPDMHRQVGRVLENFPAKLARGSLVLHRLNAALLGNFSQQTRLHRRQLSRQRRRGEEQWGVLRGGGPGQFLLVRVVTVPGHLY